MFYVIFYVSFVFKHLYNIDSSAYGLHDVRVCLSQGKKNTLASCFFY